MYFFIFEKDDGFKTGINKNKNKKTDKNISGNIESLFFINDYFYSKNNLKLYNKELNENLYIQSDKEKIYISNDFNYKINPILDISNYSIFNYGNNKFFHTNLSFSQKNNKNRIKEFFLLHSIQIF